MPRTGYSAFSPEMANELTSQNLGDVIQPTLRIRLAADLYNSAA